jgi:hypothetical protein
MEASSLRFRNHAAFSLSNRFSSSKEYLEITRSNWER